MSYAKLYDFDLALKALRQSYEDGGGWTGETHEYICDIGASVGPPQTQLDKDGLEYHQERDRDLLDTLFMVAIQIGINNGAVIQSRATKGWKDAYDRLAEVLDIISKGRSE